jgi:hypothetical protein
MSLFWLNSTKSGLCDRLLDLFLITSYAQLLDKKIYLKWEIQPINNVQKQIWNSIRFDDYKIENVKKYFIFPNIINILFENEFETEINNILENDIIFNDYLGGIYSPFTFYERFIDNTKYTIEMYINIFNNLIMEFKATENLLKLIPYIPNSCKME